MTNENYARGAWRFSLRQGQSDSKKYDNVLTKEFFGDIPYKNLTVCRVFWLNPENSLLNTLPHFNPFSGVI
jgi:hypothetical protein